MATALDERRVLITRDGDFAQMLASTGRDAAPRPQKPRIGALATRKVTKSY